MVNPAAINAYINQVKLAQEASAAPPSLDSGAPAGQFENMVKGALESAKDTLASSEKIQMEAMSGGKVDLADLVTAVSEAELTLNTVVAVRDKVITAYNDIVKMPI